MLIRKFEGLDGLLLAAKKWLALIAIAITTSTGNSLFAQSCDSIYEVINFDAADGLLPDEMNPPWIAGCGSSTWIDGELTGNALHILDNSNQTTDPPNGLRSAYCKLDIIDCPSQDAVYEVVGKAQPGADSTPPHNIDIVWLSGIRAIDKSVLIAITDGAVGFISSSSPIDWVESDGLQAKIDLDTTDMMHTYRVEKHGQTIVKLFVDNQLQLTWDYDALATANDANHIFLATNSSPGVSEFSIQSFSYRIGATSFNFDPSDCDADLNDDGVVGTIDLLNILASWGPCNACPADFDGDNNVGTSDLLFALGLWGLLDENCSYGDSNGNVTVTGNSCNPNIPSTAYQVVDLGFDHFDVYLTELYAPYDYSYFEIHPTITGQIIDHIYIDVEGPPAGSPVVVRVLPSCNDPELKFEAVNNIIENADGEHLLNMVDVAGTLGLISIEAIGDIYSGGDITDDIIATTPDNPARGITTVDSSAGIFADILAPLGRIKFIRADGDIGTIESPIAIEAKHFIRNISQAQNVYADINARANGGEGTISKLIVDSFFGSLEAREMSTEPSGGLLRFNIELDATITFGESYAGTNRKIEMPVGGLTTQIIFNVDNIPDAIWNAPVKIGFDGDPEQIILNGPGYTITADALGGGSIGIAPFDLHDESCVPTNGETIELTESNPVLQVRLRHYGPIAINANAPVTIERRPACTNEPFVLLYSADFLYIVDPDDANSLLISGSPGADGFANDYEYRIIATVDLMCDKVIGNPSVQWDSFDYRVTVCPCCIGALTGGNKSSNSQENTFGSRRNTLNKR